MFDCNSWEAFLLKVPYFNITSYITFKKCLLLYFIFFFLSLFGMQNGIMTHHAHPTAMKLSSPPLS